MARIRKVFHYLAYAVKLVFVAVIAMVSLLISAALLLKIGFIAPADAHSVSVAQDVSIMDAFDSLVARVMIEAQHEAEAVHKYFWIEDGNPCPVPNQSFYGEAHSADELQWLLDDAAALLDGQTTLFNTEIDILDGSTIHYYLDDSILAITWKQVYDNFVYTISEVKVADPSQFRRYIADETYNSKNHYTSMEMAAMNNAVVASSADFYHNRTFGTVVYDREIYRFVYPRLMDVCYVDTSGDLNFVYRNEIQTEAELQTYLEENDILFSLCFGPVLVDNGVQCNPEHYSVGEIDGGYPRAALCQYDKLHYIVLAATAEGPYRSYHSVFQLADVVATFGCQKAYTLDGGQTANIVMNNRLINKVNYPTVRAMSDIIYFASAVPNP